MIVVNYILGSDQKIYTKLFLLNISGSSLSSKEMTNTTTATIKSKINMLEIYHLRKKVVPQILSSEQMTSVFAR